MEPGGGQRWAEGLRALQLPDSSAGGGGASGISALLTRREEMRDDEESQVILTWSVRIRVALRLKRSRAPRRTGSTKRRPGK